VNVTSHAESAARLLWAHWTSGRKLVALPTPLRPTERAQGYAIQAQLPAAAGRGVLGWKIAATSTAGQAHIGVGGPLAGRLLEGQVGTDGAVFSLAGNGMRVAEPEFVFRFGTDLAPRGSPYTVPEVLAAVASLHPGLELPDSRFADFALAGEAQLLADDACAHQFVLGAAAPAVWRGLDLAGHEAHASVTGAGTRHCTRDGSGAAVLGDPRAALAWLVNELSALGLTLKAGQFVTTGTCMVPLALEPGDRVHADYGVLGTVSVALTD
jgi:2-keto-4-pentenoate hydratase